MKLSRQAAELISDEAAEIEPSDEGLGADELILQYRRVRAKIEDMKNKHDEALKPYVNVLAMLKEELKRVLDAAGADSCSTDHGTAYKSVKTTVKMEDKPAFIWHVLNQTPGMHEADLNHIKELIELTMDVKPNKTYVDDFIHEYNDLPEGVQVSRYIDINVRK
jgi:hypothetical protein